MDTPHCHMSEMATIRPRDFPEADFRDFTSRPPRPGDISRSCE